MESAEIQIIMEQLKALQAQDVERKRQIESVRKELVRERSTRESGDSSLNACFDSLTQSLGERLAQGNAEMLASRGKDTERLRRIVQEQYAILDASREEKQRERSESDEARHAALVSVLQALESRATALGSLMVPPSCAASSNLETEGNTALFTARTDDCMRVEIAAIAEDFRIRDASLRGLVVEQNTRLDLLASELSELRHTPGGSSTRRVSFAQLDVSEQPPSHLPARPRKAASLHELSLEFANLQEVVRDQGRRQMALDRKFPTDRELERQVKELCTSVIQQLSTFNTEICGLQEELATERAIRENQLGELQIAVQNVDGNLEDLDGTVRQEVERISDEHRASLEALREALCKNRSELSRVAKIGQFIPASLPRNHSGIDSPDDQWAGASTPGTRPPSFRETAKYPATSSRPPSPERPERSSSGSVLAGGIARSPPGSSRLVEQPVVGALASSSKSLFGQDHQQTIDEAQKLVNTFKQCEEAMMKGFRSCRELGGGPNTAPADAG